MSNAKTVELQSTQLNRQDDLELQNFCLVISVGFQELILIIFNNLELIMNICLKDNFEIKL